MWFVIINLESPPSESPLKPYKTGFCSTLLTIVLALAGILLHNIMLRHLSSCHFCSGCGPGTSVYMPEGTVIGSKNGCQWTGLTLKQNPDAFTFQLSPYHIKIFQTKLNTIFAESKVKQWKVL
jgi:hypothetical protein